MAYSLTKEKVVDSWNHIIENGAGREKWVIEKIVQNIKDSNIPGVTSEFTEVSSGMFGERRNFLLMRHAKMRDYKLFIGSRDFGAHLDTSWYLTCEPGFLKRNLSKYTQGNPHALSQNVDIFSQQDMGAFVTVAHHCVKRALELLCEEIKQDPSGLNSRSKGFLSVW